MNDRIDEDRRRQFESAWTSGRPEPIEDFLPDPESELYTGTLEELVIVELEFGWRRADGPGAERPRVEPYLKRFPRLDRPDVVLRLLRQEFAVRHRFGDRPPVAGYRERFPDLIATGQELGLPPEPVAGGGLSGHTHLGRYRLIEEYARGGFGAVWRARDEKLGREIALKQLTGRPARLPDFRGRFMSEARITARLEHPGIVPVYDLSEADEDPTFYAMKLVRGRTLAEAIQHLHGLAAGSGERAVEERRLLNAFLLVCQTMEFAHARGVVHRDLKPLNIVLGDFGETVILDWGLATSREAGETGETGEGAAGSARSAAIQGTPAYMSPEQATGRADELDARTDVYSLGVTLYQLLTGRVPFEAPTGEKLLEKVVEGRPARPRTLNPAVHPALEAVCLEAMAADVAGRYPTVADLTRDLQRFLADEPVSVFPEPFRLRAVRWIRRHRALVTGLAATVIVAVIGLAIIAAVLVASNRREQAAKKRAEAHFDLAREAVDRYCIRVSEHPKLRAAGFEDLRKELYRAAADFYETFVRQSEGDPDVLHARARSYINLALIVRDTESPGKAVPFYSRAIDMLGELVEQGPPLRNRLLDLAAARNDLGTVFLDLDRRDRAEAQFRAALSVCDRVDRLYPENRTPPRVRGPLLQNMSCLLSDRGDLVEAERLILEAIEVFESRPEPQPGPGRLAGEHRWQLAMAYHNRALLNVPEKLNRPGEREAAFRKALALCQELTETFPLEPLYQVQLAVTRKELAGCLGDQGRQAEARSLLDAALDASRKLVRAHPGVPRYMDLEAHVCRSLGILFASDQRIEKARELYREALALRISLHEMQPAVRGHETGIARIHIDLGCLHGQAGEQEAARDEFDQAAQTFQSLATRFPREVEHRQDAGYACFQAGQSASILGDLEGALERLDRAVHYLESVVKARPDDHHHVGLLRKARVFHAWLLARAGRFDEAREDWARMADLGAQGVYPGQLEQAARMTGRAAGDDPERTYLAGLILALAAGAVEPGTGRADRFAEAAVLLLEDARAAGYFDEAAKREVLETAAGLAPLRERRDFRALLERIRK